MGMRACGILIIIIYTVHDLILQLICSSLPISHRGKHGRESVILSDIKKPEPSVLQEGPYVYGDICDAKHLHSVVVDHAVDWVVNYSALLSAAAEDNVLQALEVLFTIQCARLCGSCDYHVTCW